MHIHRFKAIVLSKDLFKGTSVWYRASTRTTILCPIMFTMSVFMSGANVMKGISMYLELCECTERVHLTFLYH